MPSYIQPHLRGNTFKVDQPSTRGSEASEQWQRVVPLTPRRDAGRVCCSTWSSSVQCSDRGDDHSASEHSERGAGGYPGSSRGSDRRDRDRDSRAFESDDRERNGAGGRFESLEDEDSPPPSKGNGGGKGAARVRDAWSDSDDVADNHAESTGKGPSLEASDDEEAREAEDAFDQTPLLRRSEEEGFHIVLLIDASGSMREKDVEADDGRMQRRIDAVMSVCRSFLQQQVLACCPGNENASLPACDQDSYSVALFADEVHWFFQQQDAQQALLLLKQAMDGKMHPSGGTMYAAALRSVDYSVLNGQATRIILLSDGRPADWHQKSLNWFQFEWLKQFLPGTMELHCIGFGPNGAEFRVLQQMASLGNGLTKRSGFRITELQQTFTDMSIHFTSTRSFHGKERVRKEPMLEFMPPGAIFQAYKVQSSIETKEELGHALAKERRAHATFVVTCDSSGVRLNSDNITAISEFTFPVTLRSLRPARSPCSLLQCTRYQYKWDSLGHDVTLVNKSNVTVRLAVKPFTKGGMRVVHEMLDSENDETLYMVAKGSKWTGSGCGSASSRQQMTFFSGHGGAEPRSLNESMKYVKSSCLAGYYADMFLSQTGKKVTALPCYLYASSKDGVKEYFCGEDFVEGVFVKWVSNNGEIADADGVEVASALAHFSWCHSNGRYMVADIQGIIDGENYIIFDPQVLSNDQSFGPADLGKRAMQNFLQCHCCNSLCETLGLTTSAQSQKSEAIDSQNEQVILLQFGSPPVSKGHGLANFRKLLTEGPQLRLCREAMKKAGYNWLLEGGALMFAKPEQVPNILCEVEKKNLCGYHIIVTSSLEHVVTEVLASMPFKMRPKNKTGAKGRQNLKIRFGIPERIDLMSGACDDQTIDVVEVVERTFLTLKPKLVKSSQCVTQSTTEAVGTSGYLSHYRGMNPRRFT